MSDTRKTIGDLDALLIGAFDGTEFVEVYPTSGGVSKRTAAGTVISSDTDDFLGATDYPSDTAWTTFTSLLNGWTGTVRYIRRAGMVTITFDDLDGSSSTGVSPITLGATYRPSETQRGVALGFGGTPNTAGLITIPTNGAISITGTAGSDTRVFGNVTYPVIT